MKNITLATSNPGKISEFSAFFDPSTYQLKVAKQFFCVEDGTTFIENALKKVKAVSSDGYILADDSGLVVPDLDHEPGLYSARYAQDGRNLEKLVTRLEQAGLCSAPAFFFCALAFASGSNDLCPLVVTASWQGEIRGKQSGNNGFGYDPIFYLNCGRSAAQLTPQEKLTVSHRGQALTKLIALL